MNVNQDMSILSLITQASFTVQCVMAILAIVSLMSWTYIFRKHFAIKRAKQQTERFEADFWSGGDLNMLHQAVTTRRGEQGALARIFEAGMAEFVKGRQSKLSDVNTLLDGSRRAMRAAYQREMDSLESHLAFLASTGSVSPYVGLFGTVWGIMTSFTAIAVSKNSSLAVVAPGIAEALFATAIGLFAAIPALMAYNKLQAEVAKAQGRLEAFADEFSAILSRQIDERMAA